MFTIMEAMMREMRPEEEQLFKTSSVLVTGPGMPGGNCVALPFVLRRVGYQCGLAWSLLDHLAVHGVGMVVGYPMVELRVGEGRRYWRALEGMERVRLEPVYLDVVRLQRFMQLLGLLDHSRREEWERGVGEGWP